MRNLIVIVFIIIGVVISGCAVKGDINTVFKSIPEVQQFLKEHPNAKIVINLWSAEEVNSSINEISANCGKRLPVLAMYKATATGDDINVTSWFDAENQQMLCTVIVGSIKPKVTGIPPGFQIPPQISILPITLPTSDAPGNDIKDIPRYPGFIRMASATEENDSTLMYYGKADVNLVSDFYSSEMPRKGWVLIFLLGSATQQGEGSILGFTKENVTVTVMVMKDAQQNITLVMISRSPIRRSADIFYPIIPETSPVPIYPVNPILPVTPPGFDCN